MNLLDRLFLCVCVSAIIAPLNVTASLLAQAPAVAEKESSGKSAGFIRRFGTSAYRQKAYQLEYSPDGGWIAAGDYNQSVYLIDAKTGETKGKYFTQYPPKAGFSFSPDGQSIALLIRGAFPFGM